MIVHRLIIPHPRTRALLVEARSGGPRLPSLTTPDRHTAEVEHINVAVRQRIGLATTVLCSLQHDAEPTGADVGRVHVLEVHGDPAPTAAGLVWRDAGSDAALAVDEAAMLDEWRAALALPAVDGREWMRPGWFAAAHAWIETALQAHGIGPPIEVVQLRSWASSCVLRARTAAGDVYCKAVAQSGRRETAVTAYLARHWPEAVPPLLAVEPERRWLLLGGSPGPTLEDVPDLAAWERAAATYARLQVACIPHRADLCELGCPERGLAVLAGALGPLAADDAALRTGAPGGLSAVEAARLRAAVPALRQRCATLQAGPIPPTLEHGDLWPGNFLDAGDGCVLIDWEDVAVGHPFLSLAPLLVGLRTYQPALDTAANRARLARAYLAPFAGIEAPERLRALLALAVPLSFIDMALRYRQQPPSVVRLHPWMRDLVPQTLRLALGALAAPAG